MKQNDFVDNIQEKFIKCSNCDHYSFDSAQGSLLERFISFFFPSIVYICLNCRKKHIIFKNGPSRNTKIIGILIPLIVAGYFVVNKYDIFTVKSSLSDISVPVAQKTETTPPSQPDSEKTSTDQPAEIQQKPLVMETGQPVTENSDTTDKAEENSLNSKTEENSYEPPSDKPVETEEIKIVKEKPQIEEKIPESGITGTIILNQRKYGVNWTQIENGIIITKMSPGPFMRAGIKIGDVITSVNGEPAGAGNTLMALRNRVFSGEVSEVTIVVLRKGEEMTFIMRGKNSSDE